MNRLDLLRRDYHVHTAYCGHATGTMEQYVTAALAANLQEFCFCDHMPLRDGYDAEHRMSHEDLPAYLDEVQRLRRNYPQLTIHLGFEADYIEGMEAYLRDFRQQHAVDYYLMSIHFVTGWPEGEWTFAYPFGSGTIVRRYQDYFRTMQAGIRSGIFDAVAHFDLVKRSQYPVCDLVPELVDEVLDDLAAAGMAMEYNTSGLRKPIEETFPALEVIRRAAARGIPICLGSDAHHPDQVGYAFETVPGLIEDLPDLIPYRIHPGT